MGQELLEVVNWEGRAVHDIVVDVNPEPGNHTSTQTKKGTTLQDRIRPGKMSTSKLFV